MQTVDSISSDHRPAKAGLLARVKSLGGDRGPYVAGAVPAGVGKVLDIGCSYGWMLEALRDKAGELNGVDMDLDALNQARKNYPQINFVHQTAASLPFESAQFDVVILSEVIEHVGDENKRLVIDEAHRVLKEGGQFIFTCPYAGMFAWTDPMDFKRRCRGLYRLYMRLARYTPHTSVEVGHKHLSFAEITGLFDNRFEIYEVRYCGFLMPFLTWILAVGTRTRLLPRRIEEMLNRFRGWESGVRVPRWFAFNIRLLARKKAAA